MLPRFLCGDDVFVSPKHSIMGVIKIVLWNRIRRKYRNFSQYPLWRPLWRCHIQNKRPLQNLICRSNVKYFVCHMHLPQFGAFLIYWFVGIHLYFNCLATAHMIKDPAMDREGALGLGKWGCLTVFFPMPICQYPIHRTLLRTPKPLCPLFLLKLNVRNICVIDLSRSYVTLWLYWASVIHCNIRYISKWETKKYFLSVCVRYRKLNGMRVDRTTSPR